MSTVRKANGSQRKRQPTCGVTSGGGRGGWGSEGLRGSGGEEEASPTSQSTTLSSRRLRLVESGEASARSISGRPRFLFAGSTYFCIFFFFIVPLKVHIDRTFDGFWILSTKLVWTFSIWICFNLIKDLSNFDFTAEQSWLLISSSVQVEVQVESCLAPVNQPPPS